MVTHPLVPQGVRRDKTIFPCLCLGKKGGDLPLLRQPVKNQPVVTACSPILYETHMHTTLCRHAEGEVEDYASVAEQRGLRGIVVTCHNPMSDAGFGGRPIRMDAAELPEYFDRIDRARTAFAGRVDVRAGLECDFFPGYADEVAYQLEGLDLHHVLGSVHPQLKIWVDRYRHEDPLQTQKTYFDHLAEAAETGLFDTISHPDLIKNSTSRHWDLERLIDHIGRTLDRIARTGVAMELNTSGVNKVIQEMNPAPAILQLMREREIPVVVGADAHVPTRVADGYEMAYDVLEAAGYDTVSFFLDRRRADVPIAEARASLIAPDSVAQ